jgi:hypothetical protein
VLRETWTEDKIAHIERDHRELRAEYQQDYLLQSLREMRSQNNVQSRLGHYRWPALREFCGGVAMVFLNIVSVELDFSILGWERDEYLLSLTDLSLEGIMQSKQHELLKVLGGVDQIEMMMSGL